MAGVLPAIRVVVQGKQFPHLIQGVVPAAEWSLVNFHASSERDEWIAVTSTAMTAVGGRDPQKPS